MVVLGERMVKDNDGVGKREGNGQWWCWEEGGLRTIVVLGRGRVQDNCGGVGKREGSRQLRWCWEEGG